MESFDSSVAQCTLDFGIIVILFGFGDFEALGACEFKPSLVKVINLTRCGSTMLITAVKFGKT